MRHPALRQTTFIASDIYSPVFDWFFAHDAFQRWQDVKGAWQLHCIGPPGAGKTTLTSLLHRHLETYFDTQPFPVVPIYIDKHVLDHETVFIEDLLEMLYLSLGKTTAIVHDSSHQVYDDYETKRDSSEPPRLKDRLRLLRKAIHLRLRALQNARAFLLLDGIDRCSQTIRMMLEEELAKLTGMGLSTFITSRFFDLDQEQVQCEHPDHDVQPENGAQPLLYRQYLDVFLECDVCEFLLCFTCRDQNRHCIDGHDDSHLVESYDHVNIEIDIPSQSLKDFIAWNLEIEHGDLGLGSTAKKPPLSDLGKSLMSNTASKSAQVHAEKIFDSAEQHIGLAKARLDSIHSMASLENVETRLDQLPTNIIAMFDAGLKHVDGQLAGQCAITVKAIAAASFSIHGEDIPDFREILRNVGVHTRSGEDIIEASRGFLLASDDTPRKLSVFHPSFFYYAAQQYNQAIHYASVEVKPVRARIEAQRISKFPKEDLPNNFPQSTSPQPIEEAPFQPFITRKGTRAWQ